MFHIRRWSWTKKTTVNFLFAPFIDIPMINVNYLLTHKVQIHAHVIRKLLYGFASVWAIIHSLKLVDYPPVQTHKSFIQ